MLLQHLSLREFRNFAAGDLDFGARFTVLHGPNGVGKTNILEALYLVATLRSFRSADLGPLVRHGAAEARVEVSGHDRQLGLGTKLAVHLTRTARQTRRLAVADGKTVRSGPDFYGRLRAILFTPEDLGVLRGSPTGRRQFLDRALFARDRAHIADIADYDKLLRSRNRVLRGEDAGIARSQQDSLLDAYDAGLAAAGAGSRSAGSGCSPTSAAPSPRPSPRSTAGTSASAWSTSASSRARPGPSRGTRRCASPRPCAARGGTTSCAAPPPSGRTATTSRCASTARTRAPSPRRVRRARSSSPSRSPSCRTPAREPVKPRCCCSTTSRANSTHSALRSCSRRFYARPASVSSRLPPRTSSACRRAAIAVTSKSTRVTSNSAATAARNRPKTGKNACLGVARATFGW
ncbi:AAA family ATPase [Nannocystis pusilla]|uniref:DNA replication/repair protein RecF n=1 Tax=Nannocystis pusilla TaxID=889268 RepID=UPI003B7DCB5E